MQDNQEQQQQNQPTIPLDNAEVVQQPNQLPNINFNRRFRRMLLKQSGYTRLKNRLNYKDWSENIKNNIANGKQLHASNTEEFIRRSREFMDTKNESIAKSLVERGFSEEVAASILEKNMAIQEKIEIKKLKK